VPDRSRLLILGVLVIAGCFPPAIAAAQTVSPHVLFDVEGTSASAGVGQSVAGIGDFNNDGVADFAIGIPNYGPVTSDSTGRVLVWFGGRIPHATPDLVLEGPQRGSLFGAVVATAGDVNGDGITDLLVTAPHFSYAGQFNRTGSGRAYVYFGGNDPATNPGVAIDSPSDFGTSSRAEGFGVRACGLGDVDGDGFGDLAVVNLAFGGRIDIFHGGHPMSTTSWLALTSQATGLPSVCGPGDMNNDGRPDLVAGFPETRLPSYPNASVWVYLGLHDRNPNPTLAAKSSAGFGASLAPAGDVNGDGNPDVVIGHPRADGGNAYVLLGGGLGLLILPFPGGIDSLGTSVAAGDVDGDGRPEIIAGAPGVTLGGPGSGAVYVDHLAAPTQIDVWTGQPGDYLGYSLAVPGDLDGNHVDEMIVGSPGRDGPALRAGRAQLLELTPHVLLEPSGNAEWRARDRVRVRWLGAAPARISLSLDRGGSWATVLDGVGGLDENEAWITVPDTATIIGRLRVTAAAVGTGTSLANVCTIQIVKDSPATFAASVVVDSHTGAAGVKRYGSTIATGGDLDGDGFPDAVIGAPADGPGAPGGAAAVGWGGPPRADLLLHGERAGDAFGSAISIAGDVDRDGRADLLIGAPGNDAGGSHCGRAYLWLNGATGTPSLLLQGEQAGESFGSSVLLGDFNGDGYADLAIGSPDYRAASSTAGIGRVRIFFGGVYPNAVPDLVLDAPTGTIAFGATLAAVDFDADGRRDLVVSSTSSNGGKDRVFLFRGGPGLDAKPDFILTGEHPGDAFGAALASAGDPNHDGHEDLLIGAPLARNAHGGTGRAYLYAGGSSPGFVPARIFDGSAEDESFGSAVAAAGDLDRDGCDDVAVGAPNASGTTPGAGVVRAFYGSSDSEPDLEWSGTQSGSWFGAALGGPGDMDGNGRIELLAGAPLFTRAPDGLVGLVAKLEAPRYAIDAPAPSAAWFTGSVHPLVWRGAEPAEIALSTDAGRTWTVLAGTAGGAASNRLDVRAPSIAADSLELRVRPVARGSGADAAVVGPIVVGHATRVARFDYTLATDGIHFAWETEPALGPDAWTSYRLRRVRPDGTGERVGPDAITAPSLVVPDFARGSTYALGAVDANGVETELARLTVPLGPTALRAWPNPNLERGPVRLSLFPPIDAAGRTTADFTLRVYDMAGRTVQFLAGGGSPTRVGELDVDWDRRDLTGRVAAPGIYFVRAESRSSGFRREHRVVLLQ